MSYKRFWGKGAEVGSIVKLSKEEQSHARVCRIREGEIIELMDGEGNFWRGAYENGNLKLTEVGKAEKETPEIILAVGVTQGGTFEQIAKQASEMGVSAIVPLKSDFGGQGIDDKRAKSKHERWEKIVEEACKQSGLYWKPLVYPITPFKSALEEYKADLNLVAALENETIAWRNLDFKNKNKIIVWIGPEGDFSKQEYKSLKKLGAKFVSLGKTVLRVETACVAAVARVRGALKNL